jgi:hypothetical protein
MAGGIDIENQQKGLLDTLGVKFGQTNPAVVDTTPGRH